MIDTFPPIEEVTSKTVRTKQAAYYLNRDPQTLRTWACKGEGLVQPFHNGRLLAWPVSEIKQILRVKS